MGQALTITALVLVSLFCMGCCLVLFRKMYKTAQRQRLVHDEFFVSYLRSRNYVVLPENSFSIGHELDRCFPKVKFESGLLEVGQGVCCICFEE